LQLSDALLHAAEHGADSVLRRGSFGAAFEEEARLAELLALLRVVLARTGELQLRLELRSLSPVPTPGAFDPLAGKNRGFLALGLLRRGQDL